MIRWTRYEWARHLFFTPGICVTRYYSSRWILLLSGILKESCTSKKLKVAVIKRFRKWFMYIPHPLMGAIYGSIMAGAHIHCGTELTTGTCLGRTFLEYATTDKSWNTYELDVNIFESHHLVTYCAEGAVMDYLLLVNWIKFADDITISIFESRSLVESAPQFDVEF